MAAALNGVSRQSSAKQIEFVAVSRRVFPALIDFSSKMATIGGCWTRDWLTLVLEMLMNRHYATVGLFVVVFANSAIADVFQYVDWTAADPAAGTASGTITLPDLSVVGVTFEVLNFDGSPGNYYFAQTAGGIDYWNPTTPYISPEVENAPPTPDILALIGGTDQTYKVTLSEPIKDPIMAILSLGQGGVTVDYDFDAPFTIVSQGAGYWGGGPTALQQLPGDILRGNEGHGTIRFDGTFSSFSWTAPFGETWHGFTYGIRTTEAIEPTIPEPSSFAMVALGCAVFGWWRRS
jgi:hypothetical protein